LCNSAEVVQQNGEEFFDGDQVLAQLEHRSHSILQTGWLNPFHRVKIQVRFNRRRVAASFVLLALTAEAPTVNLPSANVT